MENSDTWANASLDLNFSPTSPQIFETTTPRSETRRDFEGLELIKENIKQEMPALIEELNRVSKENRKLTEILSVLCDNYYALLHRFGNLKTEDSELNSSKKRKADTINQEYSSNRISPNNMNNKESSSSEEESCTRPINHQQNINNNVSSFRVWTDPSDTSLVVKDGYHWRKYGQKVTRDNPSPRAYFRCSYAPSCPVKKKVQRSVEDASILVASYEGNHNHIQPAAAAALSATGKPSVATFDLVQSSGVCKDHGSRKSLGAGVLEGIDHILVQKMAASLTRDPDFTAALASAIQARFFN